MDLIDFSWWFAIGKGIFFIAVLGVAIHRQRDNPFAVQSSAASILLVIYNTWFLVLSNLVVMNYAGLVLSFDIGCFTILLARSAIIHSKKKNGSIKHVVEVKEGGTGDDLVKEHEILRKLFHLSGFSLIFAYFILSPLMYPVMDLMAVPRDDPGFIMFILACAVDLVLMLDAQRIMFGEDFGYKHATILLREKEIGSPGAHSYLLASALASWMIAMVFSTFIGIEAMAGPLAGIMVATLADGMAAIIGKAKGKRKVSRSHGQVKSVEGFIAGAITAFLVTLPFLLFVPWGWLISIIVAIVFLVMDYWSPPVADNILNPVIVTLVIDVLLMVVRA